MKTILSLLFIAGFILFTGCKDNAVKVQEDDTLTAELTISTDHIHTLSEITYTVKVTDSNGNIVTNLETVQVERKGHGSDTWRGTDLTLSGNTYTGTYTFSSSGEYDIRVSGIASGESNPRIMYEMEEHLNVARAHENVGDYRIEYENFPGHVHNGDEVTVKFWVSEAEKDASGNRPPVTGLDLHIHCTNPDNTTEHHDMTAVTEESSGVYITDHIFIGHGEAMMGMHFTAPDNTEIKAEFHMHVAAGH